MFWGWLNVSGGMLRGVMIACAAVVAAVLLLLWCRRLLGNMLLRGLPRLQQKRLVDLLQTDTLADPLGVVRTLSGNNAGAYLHRLWTRAKGDIGRATAEMARADAANVERLKSLTETEWPSQRLVAEAVPAADGWHVAVVTLPPAQRDGETYFIGVAVPAAAVSRGDAALARRTVRFFMLNKWGLGRDTDFVKCTSAGRTLTYNVGTGKSVKSFAAAIGEKLRTPLPAWANRTPGAPAAARESRTAVSPR
jgi:hypothetical protein